MSRSEQASDPGTSGRGSVLEPKITFMKGGGYIIEPLVVTSDIMQDLKVQCHEGLIIQAWYHETALAVEQQPRHNKTIAHLTEVIDLEFFYRGDGQIWVDGYMRITPAYLDKRRKLYEHRRWLKRVNPTLYQRLMKKRRLRPRWKKRKG